MVLMTRSSKLLIFHQRRKQSPRKLSLSIFLRLTRKRLVTTHTNETVFLLLKFIFTFRILLQKKLNTIFTPNRPLSYSHRPWNHVNLLQSQCLKLPSSLPLERPQFIPGAVNALGYLFIVKFLVKVFNKILYLVQWKLGYVKSQWIIL